MRQKELDISGALQWNFDNFITPLEWATWFMARWDHYVDETLSHLQGDFNLKFFDASGTQHRKYATVMQFVDFASMHDGIWQFESQRLPLAALFYLIIGGKDLMFAFQADYGQMMEFFSEDLPITGKDCSEANLARLGDVQSIQFYNELIGTFFMREFGLVLD